jgi:hypothetical protein
LSRALAKLFASRFIARPDVKAIQLDRAGGGLGTGDWFPDTRVNAERRPNSPHLPAGFSMDHLLAHIEGRRTYGHYLLGSDNTCKVFAFDIDLKAKSVGTWVDFESGEVHDEANPLELWRSKSNIAARNWYKYQMKMLAHRLAVEIGNIGGVDCAVAYSGHKGVHVYGFTGPMPAVEVREAAILVLDEIDEFEAVKGQAFWEHKNDDPVHGFKNFSIEVFPKQVDLKNGKQLGNLMRLPLGVNHKAPKDPTFFLDMTAPLGQFTPVKDPIELLTKGNPFV